jgi:hypothetical protein
MRLMIGLKLWKITYRLHLISCDPADKSKVRRWAGGLCERKIVGPSDVWELLKRLRSSQMDAEPWEDEDNTGWPTYCDDMDIFSVEEVSGVDDVLPWVEG